MIVRCTLVFHCFCRSMFPPGGSLSAYGAWPFAGKQRKNLLPVGLGSSSVWVTEPMHRFLVESRQRSAELLSRFIAVNTEQ